MITIDSFSNLHSPQYASETGQRINLICDIDGIGTDIPFTASADDSEEHGRQLYQNAVAGLYGAVAPLPPPAAVEIANQARRIRDGFIRTTDPMVITDYSIQDEYLTGEQREALFDIRMNFRRWPAQPGWPQIPLPIIPQWISDELNARGYTLPAWPQQG